MSLPSTGFVRVETALGECSFNGETWTSENEGLSSRLNEVVQVVPKHHYLIEEVAKKCLERAGVFSGRVIEARQDHWTGEDAEIEGID